MTEKAKRIAKQLIKDQEYFIIAEFRARKKARKLLAQGKLKTIGILDFIRQGNDRDKTGI